MFEFYVMQFSEQIYNILRFYHFIHVGIGFIPVVSVTVYSVITEIAVQSFIFDWMFMRLAEIQERHKISYHFKFLPDQTIHFRVTCPYYFPNIFP